LSSIHSASPDSTFLLSFRLYLVLRVLYQHSTLRTDRLFIVSKTGSKLQDITKAAVFKIYFNAHPFKVRVLSE
jgi:hypothetical protein